MRLKDNTNLSIHVNPPYQLMVIHSSKLVYSELYQRGGAQAAETDCRPLQRICGKMSRRSVRNGRLS